MTLAPDRFRITQEIAWRGPREWAADDGRHIAAEVRTLEVRAGNTYHILDIRSRLAPTQWDMTLGPTRHAYFNVRVAESMRATHGGRVIDAEGCAGGDAITNAATAWIDYSGPVGGGHTAGIAVFPSPPRGRRLVVHHGLGRGHGLPIPERGQGPAARRGDDARLPADHT